MEFGGGVKIFFSGSKSPPSVIVASVVLLGLVGGLSAKLVQFLRGACLHFPSITLAPASKSAIE